MTRSLRKTIIKLGQSNPIFSQCPAGIVSLATMLILSIAAFFITPNSQIPSRNTEANELATTLGQVGIDECATSQNWHHCYQLFFERIGEKKDLGILIAILQSIQRKDEKTLNCHILSHTITKVALTEDLKNWKRYLSIIDPYACNYGYVHGLIEGRSIVDKTFVINKKTIPAFCLELQEQTKSRGIDQTCSHIMGHIMLVDKEDDIPTAITGCNELPQWQHRECFAGTFMEHFTRDDLVAHGIGNHIPWNDENIRLQEQICESYTGLASISCWQEISHMYNNRAKFDPTAVYKQCQKAPTSDAIDACYMHGVNTLATNQVATSSYRSSLCAPYEKKSASYNACTNNIIFSLIFSGVSLTKQALAYCDASLSTHQATCYRTVGRALNARTTQDEKITWCKLAPKNFYSSCMNER